MRKHKDFYVVVYDVALTKPRTKIAAILERYGRRVNKSVFECMVTPAEAARIKNEIGKIIDAKKDSVVFYPLCIDCYSKAEYFPDIRHTVSLVKVVA